MALSAATDPPRPWVETADIDAAIARLAAVWAEPRRGGAARVLVQLLRLGPGLGVDAALVAESFAYSMLLSGPGFAGWRAERPVRTGPDAHLDETVRLERHDDLLRVGLNRPRVHNAYNRRMRDQLCAALAVAGADPACRVELWGEGPSFCSGGDLDEFGRAPDPVSAHEARTQRSPARMLAAIGPRVTAFIHGACVGSGIELPAFAGRVVAGADTRIWLPELGMGLIPGAGGTVSLPRRIGRQRTAWLGLTGAHLDASTARSWGLVDELADWRRT